jgi:hypothetical protein
MHIDGVMRLIRRGSCLAAAIALACVWSDAAPAANIVQNPGFEDDASKFTPPGPCGTTLPNGGVSGCDLTAWTASASGAGEDIADPNSGSVDGFFDTGSLSQSLTTAPGATYAISFFLAADLGTLTDAFFFALSGGILGSDATVDVQFGGDDLTSPPIDAVNDFLLGGASPNQYFQFAFSDTASAASTLLMFTGTNLDGTWYLDNVSVSCTANCGGSTTPVPEPAGLPLLLTALAAWPVVARLRRKEARA